MAPETGGRPVVRLKYAISNSFVLLAVAYTVLTINRVLWPLGPWEATAAAFYDVFLIMSVHSIWKGLVRPHWRPEPPPVPLRPAELEAQWAQLEESFKEMEREIDAVAAAADRIERTLEEMKAVDPTHEEAAP